jgi:hypothetical protein
MYKLAFLIIIIWSCVQHSGKTFSESKIGFGNDVSNKNIFVSSENVTGISCMTMKEALVTNARYTNTDVIWSRPKGLLYGNFVGSGAAQKANLFPDLSSTYFVFNIDWEGNLTVTGRYPNARYFSFTAAKQLGNGQLGNGNYLRGDQIVPDHGSLNPFLSSNGRNVTNRNYTIKIVQGELPSNPSNNILYTGNLTENNRAHISIRTYLADVGYDGTGNVKLDDLSGQNGLPKVTLNLFEEDITGPILLRILHAEKNGDPNGYEVGQWLSNIQNSKDKINAPCLPIPVAQVFWNTDYSVTGAFETNPEKRVREYPPNGNGGFATNPDTKYMVIPFSFDFGEVLVVQGKMPTHPKTRRGETTLPKDPQVQYFSVSTAAAPPSGEGWDTLCDEQIPLDKDGNYTIVVSWAWNRPANAILENGVGWLNPGNGEGHYVGSRNWVGLLYFRYQNTSPNWKESPNNIRIPTVENPIPEDPIVMGSYYPKGEYMSITEFERLY